MSAVLDSEFIVQYQDFLKERAQSVLKKAQTLGASDCAVNIAMEQSISLTLRNQQLETLEQAQGQQVAITVYSGQRCATTTTTNLSAAAIELSVQQAYQMAQIVAEDQAAGLPEKQALAHQFSELDLFHLASQTVDELVDLARQVETAAIEENPTILQSEGVQWQAQQQIQLLANSEGFCQSETSTEYALFCHMLARADGQMQRDFDYAVSRNYTQFNACEIIGRQAAHKTLARLKPRRISSGRYPIIFTPACARGLLGHLLQALSGRAQYQQASFLLDQLGQKILPNWFSLRENPHLRQGLASANFDVEGVATRDNQFINQGIIEQYLLSSYSARRLKRATTGNAGGARNVIILAPTLSPQELYRQLPQAILVTELLGQGVNLVTGDYSRGAIGFWLQNGEIQYPIEQFTIAGQLANMYQQLLAIGDDIDRRGNINTGSWLIEQMAVAAN